MELGVVCGLAYWGYAVGGPFWQRLLLAVLAPTVGFGFWGLLDFHQAGRLAEPLRLMQELVVSGLAGLALSAAGAHALGFGLIAVSVVHHALVYVLGGRLLKR